MLSSKEAALFLQQTTSWHAWRLRREKGRSRQLCPFPADDRICCIPRYGLPVNFQAMLLQPNRKSVKRLRDVLNVVFKHLDEVAAASIMDPGMDIPGLQLSNQEYYPYVYFKIDLSLLDCS